MTASISTLFRRHADILDGIVGLLSLLLIVGGVMFLLIGAGA